MNLNYRQGLISFQQSGSQPLFLLPSSTAGYLDLSVSPTPLIGTIAHGSSDYLLKFDATIPAAFGPLVSGQNNYLYLELNVISGEITRGITTLEPVHSTTEPTGTPGLMWFDLNANVYKVRNNQNTKWVQSPRLVLAIAVLGNPNQLIYKPVGSEIALLNGVEGHPGYLMLDSQLRPLRTSTGELLTSDTPVRLKTTVGTAGVLSSPVNTFVPVRANEPIPALRLVYFTSADAVSLASSDPALVIPKFPVGLVQQPLAQNEVGVITQAGEIVSDQWNGSLGWADADIGKPLYCGYNGEVTLTRPSGVQAYRVGYVKNNKSVLFNVDSETKAQVVSAPGSVISGVPPISAVTALNGVGEIVTTISMTPADSTHDGFMSMLHVQALSTFDSRITANTIDITTLQSSKADVGHGHTIAEVTALQGALDTLTAGVAARIPLVVPSTAGNIPKLTALGALVDSGFAPASFALASHQHFISDVTGLQDALNAKRDLLAPILISEVTGLSSALAGKADLNHSQAMSTINGLGAALLGKADAGHFHPIAEVVNLQEALDLKFNANGFLPLAQVTGLVDALAGKASLVHAHAVSDVTGLQALLDGKAAVSHTHTASQITDFNVAVNTEVASLLQAGANIQLQYNAGSGQLVIAAVHNHPISEVTGLQSALDGKAPLVHVHGISEVTGLQAALDGKSNVGHTHVYSDVTNFGAGVSAKLHAGSNITLTYDGAQDWTTIAASVPAQTPLQFFEGVSARGSYPTVTSVVFGAGLTATANVAGDTLTVTAPSVHTLDGLDDVVSLAPANGQVLTYNGTNWAPSSYLSTMGISGSMDPSNIGVPMHLQITALNNTTRSDAQGGNIMLMGGVNSAGHVGGDVIVYPGAATGTGPNAYGGGFVVVSGAGTNGSGSIELYTADTTGTSGAIILKTGVGSLSSSRIELMTSGSSRLSIQGNGTWMLAGNPGSTGQVLTSTGGSSAPIWASPAIGSTTLAALTDVSIPAPLYTGNLLMYNEVTTKWESGLPKLGSLLDVYVDTAVAGDVLTFDGTNWVPGSLSVQPWAYTLNGYGTVSGYNSTTIGVLDTIPTMTTSGVFQYRPLKAYNSATPLSAAGYGDVSSPIPAPDPAEPIIISENAAVGELHGATKLVIPSSHLGGEWMITVELVLNPTYLGFAQDFLTNQSSKKPVTVEFQLWAVQPYNLTDLSTIPPEFKFSSTQVVLQRAASGTGLDQYVARFTASAQVFLWYGDHYLTWSSFDIPAGVGTEPITGLPYSTVTGARVSLHRIFEAGIGG